MSKMEKEREREGSASAKEREREREKVLKNSRVFERYLSRFLEKVKVTHHGDSSLVRGP